MGDAKGLHDQIRKLGRAIERMAMRLRLPGVRLWFVVPGFRVIVWWRRRRQWWTVRIWTKVKVGARYGVGGLDVGWLSVTFPVEATADDR